MRRQTGRKGSAKLVAALAALAIVLAILPHGRFGLGLRLEARGARAVLDLGLASFRIAFDFGRSCPKSNSCSAAFR